MTSYMPMGEGGGGLGQKHMSGNWQGKMPVRVDEDTSQAVCLSPFGQNEHGH